MPHICGVSVAITDISRERDTGVRSAEASSPITLRYRTCLNVSQNDSVGTYSSMRTDLYSSKNLRSRANVDVAADFRQFSSGAAAVPDRYLLKYQAVHADPGIRMDDDSVRVRNKQSASDPAVERDIRAGHDRPKTMAQDDDPSVASSDVSRLLPQILIAPYGPEKFSARIPELHRPLTPPVRNVGAYWICLVHVSIR